jgi:hypothetical protein
MCLSLVPPPLSGAPPCFPLLPSSVWFFFLPLFPLGWALAPAVLLPPWGLLFSLGLVASSVAVRFRCLLFVRCFFVFFSFSCCSFCLGSFSFRSLLWLCPCCLVRWSLVCLGRCCSCFSYLFVWCVGVVSLLLVLSLVPSLLPFLGGGAFFWVFCPSRVGAVSPSFLFGVVYGVYRMHC